MITQLGLRRAANTVRDAENSVLHIRTPLDMQLEQRSRKLQVANKYSNWRKLANAVKTPENSNGWSYQNFKYNQDGTTPMLLSACAL
jgi:hypothetical protein